MTIEVDAAWGRVDPAWQLSEADRFAWTAGRHGYDVFFKVPCCSRLNPTPAPSHILNLYPEPQPVLQTRGPEALRPE